MSVAFLAAFVAVYALITLYLPLAPLDPPLEVEIQKGMTFRQATALLANRGLIRDDRVFIALGRLSGLDKKVAPGIYSFEGRLSPWDIFRMLREGDITPWEITVVEGDTLEQIKAKLMAEGLVTEGEFDRLAADQGFMKEMGIEAPSLEGYLYPDTYWITEGQSAEEILTVMVRRMREKFDGALRQRAEEIGMTENGVLTLASIVEKEAAVDEERAVISAVYHNRLRRGMPLQADPTAVYGVKPQGMGITKQDVKRDTPYNTYLFKGLPPGPIASPGIKSIRAALYPDDVPFLYFVSNRNGTHTFSETLKEHEEAVKLYRQNRTQANGANGKG